MGTKCHVTRQWAAVRVGTSVCTWLWILCNIHCQEISKSWEYLCCLSWGIHLFFLNIIYMNWRHEGRRRSYFYCDVSSCKHLAAIVNICGSAICIVFRLFVVTSCQVDFFAVASRNMKISSKNQWLDYISNLTTCISNYHHLLSDFWNKEMHIVSTVSWWRVVKTFYLFQI